MTLQTNMFYYYYDLYFRGNKTHLSAKSKPLYGKLKHLSVGPHDFVGRTTIYFL